jgi:16S rRNA (cytosine967-C5)-methyltransferase
MNERLRALELLRRIERESSFASLLLHNESGFVRTLVLGVLRWRSRLDFVIDQLSARGVEPDVRDVLRLGVLQLLFTKTALHAAVSETVDLAPIRARGFVNALLRRLTREGEPEPRDVATRTAHPPWLIARWSRRFGEERAAKIAAANQELSFPDVLSEAPPADAEPSALVPGMWKLRGSSAEVEGYALDEGSGVIADLAAATSRDILDLAAAPGGKTIVMRSRGADVVSNDVSLGRLVILSRKDGEGSVRAGDPHTDPSASSRLRMTSRLVVSDGRQPPFARRFSTVLVDAPCSATGTIRKNPELKWRLRESDIANFVPLQRELLASACELAREFVVYSTCSLEPEENDEVVKTIDEFEIVDAAQFANAEVAKWIEDGVLRLTPESGADGFTAFALRRKR